MNSAHLIQRILLRHSVPLAALAPHALRHHVEALIDEELAVLDTDPTTRHALRTRLRAVVVETVLRTYAELHRPGNLAQACSN